ncbi:MAG: M48 family metallopeptidase [Vicinamibacterales bacterium]
MKYSIRTISAVAVSSVLLMGAGPQLVSVNQEVQIGREAQRQIKRDVPVVNDGTVNRYVDSVGARLVRQATGPRYPYSFDVANFREINAFALPGGPVWIHRGALSSAQNESQVAGVLAHEIAHIAQRHAASQMTKGLIANGLLGLLGAIVGNDRGGQIAQIAGGLAAQGYMLKFSRDDEREADEVGAQIMKRAGWNPNGMVEFMQILRAQAGRDPGSVQTFLSSHPAPAERVTRLQSTVRRVGATGTRDSQAFRQVKSRLNRLAPAPSMRTMRASR